MKKTFEMTVPAAAFFSDNIRHYNEADADEETKIARKGQEDLIRETFNLTAEDSFETTVGMRINLEDFLWQLFVEVPAPPSPLKMAAHKRHLDLVAAELNSSLGKDELPNLSKESLEMIKPYVDNEDKFKEIKVPYEIIPAKPATESKSVPLPAINVLRDFDFISTLDHLFNGI
jgi:hypothetical protein